MTRRLIVVATLVIVVLATTQLWAHKQYRIVGTITKFAKNQLSVKNKAGKMYSIAFDDLTIVRRDKAKVAVAELKTGLSVVVDALGDSEKDLVAVEVRLVPAITPPKK